MWKQSLCAAAVVAAVGGCARQSQPAGDRIVAWQRGLPVAVPARAAEPGRYALFTDDSDLPLYTVELDAGDSLGFRRLPDDRVIGYADGQAFSIDGLYGTSFYWDYQGEADARR